MSQNKTQESIGVITSVETEQEGTVNVSEIDSEKRKEFAEELSNKIADIDGVRDCHIAALAPFTHNQKGTFEVILERDDTHSGTGCMITGNVRSIAQHLHNTLKESEAVSTYLVTTKPHAIESSMGWYNIGHYTIDFSLV